MRPDIRSASGNLALIDLDGVVCNDVHRVRHALERDWGTYFSLMVHDTPWRQGRELVDAVILAGWDLAYLTGRREDTRPWTKNWLNQHGFPTDVPLLMRPIDDRRRLAELKAAAVAHLLGYNRQVWMYDDDPDVIAAVNQVPGGVGRHCTWHIKEKRLVSRGKS